MSQDEKIDIFNSRTIKMFMDQLFKDKLEVRVWQKIEETKKFTFGIIVNYKHHEELIKIQLKDSDINFNQNRELYFHTTYKDTIFKTDIVSIKKNILTIKRPTLVKIREARSEERKNFGMTSFQFAEIRLPDGEVNKVQVLDSSNSGMGIMVKRTVFSNIHKGQEVIIINSSVESHIGSKAIVRSIGPIDNVLSKDTSFRIGLEVVA